MISRRKTRLLAGTAVVAVLVVISAITGFAGEILSSDTFNSSSKVEISQHSPDNDASGDGWSVELGDWEVHNGKVKEKSDAVVGVSDDYRAMLDADDSDLAATVGLKIEGGDQIWGPVVRHSGPRDWIMAFHDNVGEIVLGKKRPDENSANVNVGISDPTAGGFQELGRVEAIWTNGQTHSITLEVDGPLITVYADDIEIMSATDDDNMTSSFAVIFSRGDGNNKLESFTVNSIEDEEEE